MSFLDQSDFLLFSQVGKPLLTPEGIAIVGVMGCECYNVYMNGEHRYAEYGDNSSKTYTIYENRAGT